MIGSGGWYRIQAQILSDFIGITAITDQLTEHRTERRNRNQRQVLSRSQQQRKVPRPQRRQPGVVTLPSLAQLHQVLGQLQVICRRSGLMLRQRTTLGSDKLGAGTDFQTKLDGQRKHLTPHRQPQQRLRQPRQQRQRLGHAPQQGTVAQLVERKWKQTLRAVRLDGTSGTAAPRPRLPSRVLQLADELRGGVGDEPNRLPEATRPNLATEGENRSRRTVEALRRHTAPRPVATSVV